MKRLLVLVMVLCCLGCTSPRKPNRKLPAYGKAIISPADSVLTVSTSAQDLKGLQQYVGDGNTITLTKSMHLSFGATQLDLPAGANATIANSGPDVAVVFKPPMPTVTAKVGKFTIHPFLEKILLRPDGTADAYVKELGQTILRKAVVKWMDEEAKTPTPLEPVPEVVKSVPECKDCISNEKLTYHKLWYSSVNGQLVDTLPEHLIRDHGYRPEQVARLTPDQRNRVHGWEHAHENPTKAAKVSAPVVQAPQYQTQCNGRRCRRFRM